MLSGSDEARAWKWSLCGKGRGAVAWGIPQLGPSPRNPLTIELSMFLAVLAKETGWRPNVSAIWFQFMISFLMDLRFIEDSVCCPYQLEFLSADKNLQTDYKRLAGWRAPQEHLKAGSGIQEIHSKLITTMTERSWFWYKPSLEIDGNQEWRWRQKSPVSRFCVETISNGSDNSAFSSSKPIKAPIIHTHSNWVRKISFYVFKGLWSSNEFRSCWSHILSCPPD